MKLIRKSIVARVDIPKGKKITKKMMTIKRPGIGLSPKHLDKINGKKAKRDIKKDEMITKKMLGD